MQKRPGSQSHRDEPGPGQYEHRSHFDGTKTLGRFGTESKDFEYHKYAKELPGPGQYEASSPQGKGPRYG